jgi:hypothetical protein
VRDLYDPVANLSSPNTVFRSAKPIAEDAAGSYWARRRARRAAVAAARAATPSRSLGTRIAICLAAVGFGSVISLLNR